MKESAQIDNLRHDRNTVKVDELWLKVEPLAAFGICNRQRIIHTSVDIPICKRGAPLPKIQVLPGGGEMYVNEIKKN